MSQTNITYHYEGDITSPEKDTIIETVTHNLDKKMTGYIDKLKKTPDTTLDLKVSIEKNKKHLFNGNITLSASGSEPLMYQREDFQDLRDLINHAFDHFKEALASK